MSSSISSSDHKTILLVDDSPRVRPLVRQILEDAGYGVIEAQSPEEALTIVGSHDSDIALLLTDFMMPGMTGVQLAGQIKQRHPNMKLLCMSGYDVNLKPDSGIEFIEKPFRPDQLVEKVRAILER